MIISGIKNPKSITSIRVKLWKLFRVDTSSLLQKQFLMRDWQLKNWQRPSINVLIHVTRYILRYISPCLLPFNKDTKLSQGQGRPLREVLIVYFKIIRSFTQAPTFSSTIVLISRDFIPNIIRTLQNTNKSKCVSLIEFWSFMVQYNCNKYIVNKSKDGNRFCQLIQSQFRKQLLL